MNHSLSSSEQKEIMQLVQYYRNSRYEKVPMVGMREYLFDLKVKLEEIYGDIFYMGYTLMDAPYHGWSGEPLKKMNDIQSRIESLARELYAVVLVGLGEDCSNGERKDVLYGRREISFWSSDTR